MYNYMINGTTIEFVSTNLRIITELATEQGLPVVQDDEYYDEGYHYLNNSFVKKTSFLEQERREERTEEFSQTIDRMNPPWYNSLTDTQKTSVETWRQQWLDYPSTGILPTRPDIF
jgi:hypothetical protein